MMAKKFLKISEVAEMLNTSRQTIYRHRKQDPKFPRPHKMAGGLRFLYDDIIAYIVSCSNDNDAED